MSCDKTQLTGFGACTRSSGHPGPCNPDYATPAPQPRAPLPDQTQKKDAGKVPLELLPTQPLEAVARVLGFGARKYAANGWRAGIAYSRVYAAVLRHCWLWWRGETIDPDSGEHHLACAVCELLFLLDYELGGEARRQACDDRPAHDTPRP